MTVSVDTPKSYDVDQKRTLYDEVFAVLDEHRAELEIADITHSFRRGTGRSRGWSRDNRFDIYSLTSTSPSSTPAKSIGAR